jgi:2,4-dienoyl-CoA reductase (NADPH2)
VLEDVWTGEQREIECAVLIDCGHRVADESLYDTNQPAACAGDCVAPRTVHEAVLEGRRRALEIGGSPGPTSRRELTGATGDGHHGPFGI